ncbi:MAG: hydrogenase formation protein HypD [Candidatus Nitronauta litoralis]|uniref:Hydrogenase formation protein HypD n=1 Tax=Candidatus Nitronauta litoralis TaxID=2705533 RepID=A0A7T0FZR1_9BACT|nr:MAG: hydrogenase formation protein HypD [Candidatus Nitronauta litoralis]
MKYIDEYRDRGSIEKCSQRIAEAVTGPWTIMEICGGQTRSIAKHGLESLLPSEITLLHGPGCPVCVTPQSILDHAMEIASNPEVVFCTFGDMMRVPGTNTDLAHIKAEGGDVRIIQSPMEALNLARENADKEVVFLAIGFETTAPANAMALYQSKQQGIKNISFLVSQVLVPPAMESILNSPHSKVQGFLAAGHVCTIMGFEEYEPIAQRYQVPIVVTGFEPLDILMGIDMVVRQLEEGRHEVENQYSRSVQREGNLAAQKILNEVFEVIPKQWRGVGEIPSSGLGLKSVYRHLNAALRFPQKIIYEPLSTNCISGQVLQGLKKPNECEAFGKECTPDSPLGATMVSSEGACAAYFHYQNFQA